MPPEEISVKSRKMARPKVFVDNMPFRDREGTFASMDDVLVSDLGEDRISLLRMALAVEIARRHRETPEQTRRRIEAYRADIDEQAASQRRGKPKSAPGR